MLNVEAALAVHWSIHNVAILDEKLSLLWVVIIKVLLDSYGPPEVQ